MRAWAGVAAIVLSATAACMVASWLASTDPMLPMEAVLGLLLAVWAGIVLADVLRGQRMAACLTAASRPATVAGRACLVVGGDRRDAMVLGALRPRMFLGEQLIRELEPDELAAIVLHEEYHRLTLAPLRSAAVHGWLRLVGRSTPARLALRGRLDAFESRADAYAVRQGVQPSSIARALVKTAPSRWGAAFAAGGNARIRALVRPNGGAERPAAASSLPYEWLPVVALLMLWVGCHLP